ncbi:MAG: hypothetical protein WD049_10245 [Candidatus Paceibacterota bacterium]
MPGPESNPLAKIDTGNPLDLKEAGVDLVARKVYLQGLLDSNDGFTDEERQRIQRHIQDIEKDAA